ncbi:MAG: hypothetical protein FJY07_07410 [Bacteroidetes bacterium]|nr:hypothetical protein [Bacteroidota bacterium]
MKFIKIYGEQNSGTIYLEWLLKKNLDAVLLDSFDFGWKHRVAPIEEELNDKMKNEVLFLCLVKNPYSWLISMHKRPYNHESLKKLSFSDFIKYSFGDYRNPIIMWNIKNSSYLRLKEYVKYLEIIRYEEILAKPDELILILSEKYGFTKDVFFKNITNLLTNTHGIKQQKFHKEYYLNEEWKRNLRSDHIRFINQFLDKELMEKLNYPIIQ